MKAPRDCWWVAATGDQVTAAPSSHRLLDSSVLLYRRRSGEVVAMADRCPHRGLPLSLGTVVDDEVVCRYHGFAFGPTGTCVRVPSQEHVPYDADVRSFPVREEGPFVWVWLGDPSRSSTPTPSAPWLTEPGWSVLGGELESAAGYLLLHDNALDRTHFAFVHPDTSHRGYLQAPPPLQVEVTETSVSYARDFPPAPLESWQCSATGLAPDTPFAQRESGEFVSPALHVDHMVIEGPDRTYRSVFVRAFTPITTGTTRVIWHVARDFGVGNPAVDEVVRRVHQRSMGEDEPLLQAIQQVIDRDGEVPGASAAADVASVKARQIVARMLGEERPHQRV